MSTSILTNAISQKLVSFNFPRLSLRMAWAFGVFIVVSLLIFYVFQINEITRGGFLVSNHESRITELSQQNRDLEIYFSQTNSLINLEELLLNSNYEKIDKVHYIQVLEGSVAYEKLED